MPNRRTIAKQAAAFGGDQTAGRDPSGHESWAPAPIRATRQRQRIQRRARTHRMTVGPGQKTVQIAAQIQRFAAQMAQAGGAKRLDPGGQCRPLPQHLFARLAFKPFARAYCHASACY